MSLIFLGSSINPLFAQTVKKSTVTAKKTNVVVKKNTTAKGKTTTISKKPVTKATPVTTANKTIPVKPVSTKALPVAELKMSAREKQMVDEINLVRADPAGYAKHVKEYLKRSNAGKHTINAANELINELKQLQPLGSLIVNWDMYQQARDYGLVMMENNATDHSDLPYNENLSFGIENIREAVIDLLIDEDIPNRGHRRNILNKKVSYVAVHELPGTVEGFHNCYIQEFK